MKKILYLVLTLCSFSAFAQETKFPPSSSSVTNKQVANNLLPYIRTNWDSLKYYPQGQSRYYRDTLFLKISNLGAKGISPIEPDSGAIVWQKVYSDGIARGDNGNVITANYIDNSLTYLLGQVGETDSAAFLRVKGYFEDFECVYLTSRYDAGLAKNFIQIRLDSVCLNAMIAAGGGGGYNIDNVLGGVDTLFHPVAKDAGGKLGVAIVNVIAANAGNVVYVSPTGSNTTGQRGNVSKPFLTIPSAITASSAGDLIHVLPGTYGTSGTQIIFSGSRKLYASQGAVITASDFYCDGTASISGKGTLIGRVIMYSDQTDDVTISDINIIGSVVYNAYNLTSSINQKLKIRNVTITASSTPAVLLMNRFGGFYHRGIDAVIDNCVLTSTSNHVIRLSGTDGLDDLTVDSPISSLTLTNSRLIATDTTKAGISAGSSYQYYFAYNYKNTAHQGSGTVVNAWAATMGTGFSVGTGGGSYTLPIASASVSGGVKVGSGLAIDGSGVLSASGGSSLPSQTGNSGKFLTTSGSAASWANVSFSTLTGLPTTVAGYGITNFSPLVRNTILTNYSSNASVFANGDSVMAFFNKAKYQIEANAAAAAGNTAAIAAFSSSSTREVITQTAHGFTAGKILRRTSGSWTTSDNTSNINSSALGIVESVTTNTFVIVYSGKITLSSLTDGADYFLGTLGGYTTVEPTATGTVSKPIFTASSTTTAIIQIQRGTIK